MKRTHDTAAAEQPHQTPLWVCFVRDEIRSANWAPNDLTDGGLFFFDTSSTVDGPKILHILRSYIGRYDEWINVFLYLAAKGLHPRAAVEEDSLDGLSAHYLRIVNRDDAKDSSEMDKFLETFSDIQNVGTWKYFPNDAIDAVDIECVRVIRFMTHF